MSVETRMSSSSSPGDTVSLRSLDLTTFPFLSRISIESAMRHLRSARLATLNSHQSQDLSPGILAAGFFDVLAVRVVAERQALGPSSPGTSQPRRASDSRGTGIVLSNAPSARGRRRGGSGQQKQKGQRRSRAGVSSGFASRSRIVSSGSERPGADPDQHVIDIFMMSVKCGNCDTYQTIVGFKKLPDKNVYTYECENDQCDPNVTRTIVEVPQGGRQLDQARGGAAVLLGRGGGREPGVSAE